MTQPAATKLIQELEDMFGVFLFKRDRRGMRPTQYGEMVKRHFELVLADVGNMCQEVDLFSKGGQGVIRLGIIPSLSSVLLAESINKMIDAYPHVYFQVHEATTDELLEQLSRNSLDVIFGRVLRADLANRLRVSEIYTETFDVVCSSRHRLVRQQSVSWRELGQERWVLPATGSPLREMAENLFTSQDVLRPTVVVASSSFHQMRTLLSLGGLVGVLPRSIAEEAERAGDLVRLRLNSRAKFAPISMVVREEVETPPLIEAFERVVQQSKKALKLV